MEIIWCPSSFVGIRVQRAGGGTLWKLLDAPPLLLGSVCNGPEVAANNHSKEKNNFLFLMHQKKHMDLREFLMKETLALQKQNMQDLTYLDSID